MISKRDKQFARRIARSFPGESGRRSSSKPSERRASVEYTEFIGAFDQQYINDAVAWAVRSERIALRRSRKNKALLPETTGGNP